MLDDRGRGRRRMVVAAIYCAAVVPQIDASAVTVALPAIGDGLDASALELSWVIAGYAVVLQGMLIVGGRLGDRFGHRRVMTVGVAVFGVAALVAALAPQIYVLLIARGAQGLGVALLGPASRALLVDTYADRDHGRGVSRFVQVTALASLAGPLLGGWLTTITSWRSVFLINVPFALAALALLALVRREPDPARSDTRIPLRGAAALVVAVLFLALGAQSASVHGPLDLLTVACLATSAIGALFLAIEQRRPNPFIPKGLLGERRFDIEVVLLACQSAITAGVGLLLSLYLQQAEGLSAVGAGVVILFAGVGVLTAAPIGGRLFAADQPRLPASLSMVLLGLGMVVVAVGISDGSTWVMATGMAIAGGGLGFGRTMSSQGALGALPAALRAEGSGVIGTLRTIGTTSGVAAAGLVVGATGASATGLTTDDATQISRSIVVGAVVAIALGALAFVGLSRSDGRERAT